MSYFKFKRVIFAKHFQINNVNKVNPSPLNFTQQLSQMTGIKPNLFSVEANPNNPDEGLAYVKVNVKIVDLLGFNQPFPIKVHHLLDPLEVEKEIQNKSWRHQYDRLSRIFEEDEPPLQPLKGIPIQLTEEKILDLVRKERVFDVYMKSTLKSILYFGTVVGMLFGIVLLIYIFYL